MSPQLVEDLVYRDFDGYGIAARARDEAGVAGENFTYGEVTPQTVYHMLTLANASEGETFYDLGCGTGKAVIYAAALTPVDKAVGVELLPGLHASAEEAKSRFDVHVRPQLPEHYQSHQVHFVNSDMLAHDFSDANIVFTHCTCFNPELMSGLTQRFEQLQPGSRVITVSKTIESPLYQCTHAETCQMGWGLATIYVQQHV
jgi:SAM-dependent methyltransferase